VRAAAALSNIRQVDEEELEVIVGSTIEKPTVIDFFATWCGPCLLLAQELEKVCTAECSQGDRCDIQHELQTQNWSKGLLGIFNRIGRSHAALCTTQPCC